MLGTEDIGVVPVAPAVQETQLLRYEEFERKFSQLQNDTLAFHQWILACYRDLDLALDDAEASVERMRETVEELDDELLQSRPSVWSAAAEDTDHEYVMH